MRAGAARKREDRTTAAFLAGLETGLRPEV